MRPTGGTRRTWLLGGSREIPTGRSGSPTRTAPRVLAAQTVTWVVNRPPRGILNGWGPTWRARSNHWRRSGEAAELVTCVGPCPNGEQFASRTRGMTTRVTIRDGHRRGHTGTWLGALVAARGCPVDRWAIRVDKIPTLRAPCWIKTRGDESMRGKTAVRPGLCGIASARDRGWAARQLVPALTVLPTMGLGGDRGGRHREESSDGASFAGRGGSGGTGRTAERSGGEVRGSREGSVLRFTFYVARANPARAYHVPRRT